MYTGRLRATIGASHASLLPRFGLQPTLYPCFAPPTLRQRGSFDSRPIGQSAHPVCARSLDAASPWERAGMLGIRRCLARWGLGVCLRSCIGATRARFLAFFVRACVCPRSHRSSAAIPSRSLYLQRRPLLGKKRASGPRSVPETRFLPGFDGSFGAGGARCAWERAKECGEARKCGAKSRGWEANARVACVRGRRPFVSACSAVLRGAVS